MTVQIQQLVSLETLHKFKIYENLLREWNRRTALVQEDTLQEFYTRHILDSLQIIPLVEEITSPSTTQVISSLSLFFKNTVNLDSHAEKARNVSIIDVGSGAGFPGMILAMCGFSNVVLCESNQKKCIFLEEVARQTKTKVIILNERVEKASDKFEIILSRACTDLETLCSIMVHASKNASSVGIFHKGRRWQSEAKAAGLSWLFDLHSYKSITSDDGVILSLQNLRKTDSKLTN